MDSLAVVVESMTKANKALREAIEKSAEEDGQLEKFEDCFRSTQERFSRFKQAVLSNNRQADELLARLEQKRLEKARAAEDLRRRIAALKHERREQEEENSRLEKALDDHLDHLKSVNITSPNATKLAYASSATQKRGRIIDRLFEDVAPGKPL